MRTAIRVKAEAQARGEERRARTQAKKHGPPLSAARVQKEQSYQPAPKREPEIGSRKEVPCCRTTTQ
jgi:ribosome assembly protein YihI (activator of Der GTPase)